MKWVLFFFLAALASLLGRLFVLQIYEAETYRELASRQHSSVEELMSERGGIFAKDKNGDLIPLALSKVERTLIASPRHIKDPESAARLLAPILGAEEEGLRRMLSKADDPYEIIQKHVGEDRALKIEELGISGLSFEKERVRVYPQDTRAAHVLGFVRREDGKEEGQYGLERTYDADLTGSTGFFAGVRAAGGFWIALGKRIMSPSENGSRLVLTIDPNIQRKAEEVLHTAIEKWGAPSGTVIVLEPSTGRIRALGVEPTFNPNEFSKEKDYAVFQNPAIESIFELGSVLKPITMSAGLEEGVVTPDTTYTDSGEVKIQGYTIKNFDLKAHGVRTMTQVIEQSLNTGVVHVVRLLGRERFVRYLELFGFGDKTMADLPGEVLGDIANLKEGREIELATAAFGQGIAVTPLQLASAIGAIANHGRLMRPYVVEQIIDGSGTEVNNEPHIVRDVISRDTAEAMTKMLISTVRNGFENRAGVKGYFVAGKTGTAQIPAENGRGYSDKVIHSYVGYAPAFDPKFLIYIQLNEPMGNRFAANTLSPTFHDLAEYILNYYEVPPDEK